MVSIGMDGGDTAGDGDVAEDGVGEEATAEGGDSSDGGELAEGDGIFTDEECVMEPIVRVYSSTGFRLSIEIDLKSTVEDLKLAVAEICGRPVEQQRLIYKGRLMKNDQTLESYGIEYYQVVQLVNRGNYQATQNSSSTSRKDGSDEQWPPERLDLFKPSILEDYDTIRPLLGMQAVQNNSMNKPSTPNTDPLPNPWTSTFTGGRRIISGVDFSRLADGLGFSDRKRGVNFKDCRGSYHLNGQASYYRLPRAGMNSKIRPQAGRRHTTAEARFNPIAGMNSARRPQAEGRHTNAGAGAHFNPVPGMTSTSASKPRAGGKWAKSGVRFHPMADTNSARRPQAEGRHKNTGAQFNPMPGMTSTSASKPQAGGKQTNSSAQFNPTDGELDFSDLGQMLDSMGDLRASNESSTSAGMNSASRPQAGGRQTILGAQYNLTPCKLGYSDLEQMPDSMADSRAPNESTRAAMNYGSFHHPDKSTAQLFKLLEMGFDIREIIEAQSATGGDFRATVRRLRKSRKQK